MKLKTLVTLIMALVCLAACSPTRNPEVSNAINGFSKVPGYENLYYDNRTLVVHYIITYNNSGYRGYGFMSPYYNEHGKTCRYHDGHFEEIE